MTKTKKKTWWNVRVTVILPYDTRDEALRWREVIADDLLAFWPDAVVTSAIVAAQDEDDLG